MLNGAALCYTHCVLCVIIIKCTISHEKFVCDAVIEIDVCSWLRHHNVIV